MKNLILIFSLFLGPFASAQPGDSEAINTIPAGTQLIFSNFYIRSKTTKYEFGSVLLNCQLKYYESDKDRFLNGKLTVKNAWSPRESDDGFIKIFFKESNDIIISCHPYFFGTTFFANLGKFKSILEVGGVKVMYPEPTPIKID